MRPLQRAIAIAGGQTALARKLRVTQPCIAQWVRRKRIPPERVLEVERETGVSRHDLRPDIYPDPA